MVVACWRSWATAPQHWNEMDDCAGVHTEGGERAVVRHGAPSKDQPLLGWWNAEHLLDLLLHATLTCWKVLSGSTLSVTSLPVSARTLSCIIGVVVWMLLLFLLRVRDSVFFFFFFFRFFFVFLFWN
eukprot:TRINITY_DN6267_c0_g2_i2.p3 TRINITY_DN6267_c0_g2~~TRINITY_DN6267_c0_g2_i2.p3  ORF type:complete len:127 (+),score=35.91 TRINITY_DN6267_c0_g2_i2:951-1331(+)